jgi:site-specific DNA recombinase
MKYILYARKSSESEERQAMSIRSQRREMLNMAQKLGVKIDKIYTENMSAKTSGRPVFDEMLGFIGKQKGCVLFAWKVDRLTRNISDGGKIVELLEKGNIREIKTSDKTITNNSNDKLMLAIDFGMGKKYVDDLSDNVKRGNREKMQQGGWPGKAPFGYLNDRVNQTVVIDPARAKFVKKMFRLCLKGLSVKEIASRLFEEGLRNAGGYRIGKSTVHHILRSPFYYGLMVRGGMSCKGNHLPLISKGVFDEVRDMLNGKHKSRRQKHFFTYRGFMNCASCDCAITADKHKGHVYYYCTNGKGDCDEHKKYLRSEKIDGLTAGIFDRIKFDEELIEIAYLAAKEKLEKSKDSFADNRKNLVKELDRIEKISGKLTDKYLEEKVPERIYETKSKQLENERAGLETKIAKIRQNTKKSSLTFEPVKKLFLEASRAKKDFVRAKDGKKRRILEILLSNLKLKSGEIAETCFKMPYQLLANTPKNADFEVMLGR